MSAVVIDDHLLRDVLTGSAGSSLKERMQSAPIYTTNLWYLRLCRSIVASAGGRLTQRLSSSQRSALGRQLVKLPADVQIVPLADLTGDMAMMHAMYPLSVLSCEALVAAERLNATLCVWHGDEGPQLRRACSERDIAYEIFA